MGTFWLCNCKIKEKQLSVTFSWKTSIRWRTCKFLIASIVFRGSPWWPWLSMPRMNRAAKCLDCNPTVVDGGGGYGAAGMATIADLSPLSSRTTSVVVVVGASMTTKTIVPCDDDSRSLIVAESTAAVDCWHAVGNLIIGKMRLNHLVCVFLSICHLLVMRWCCWDGDGVGVVMISCLILRPLCWDGSIIMSCCGTITSDIQQPNNGHQASELHRNWIRHAFR